MGLNARECISLLSRGCREAGCPELVCVSLAKALEGIHDSFCVYARLRLALETAVQEAYYTLLGVGGEEKERRIRVRSRFYASFTASMIKQLRGVHGQRKRWLLNTYLRLGELLHPTAKLRSMKGLPSLDEKLITQVLDAIAYLCTLLNHEPATLQLAEKCRLEKTARLLERRAGRG